MRKLFRAFCVFFTAAVVAASCGASDDGASRPAGAPAFAEVPVWVEPIPAFDGIDASASCAFWCFEGVACANVRDETRAKVLLRADPAKCVKSADGTFHLGDAHYEPSTGVATIFLRVDCFRNPLPASLAAPYDRDKLRSVLAHELGHTFGIWDHVPEACSAAHKTLPDGRAACGDALMNALWEPKTQYPTAVDDLAFRSRDERRSVLQPVVPVPFAVPRRPCLPRPR